MAGLKGKVRQMVSEMHAIRTNRNAPRDISLREHLSQKYEQSPDHLFSDLEINQHSTRVNELMEDEDARYLVPEVIRQGIQQGMGEVTSQAMSDAQRVSQGPILSEGNGGQRWISPEAWLEPHNRGAVQAGYYNDLIIRDEPVSQDSVNIPYFNLSDAGAKDTDEGATVEEGTVDYNSKKVVIKAKARQIKISYEAIMFNTISLLALFFQDFGRRFALSLTADAVDVIVNGDLADGSEAAPVIGVQTAGQYAYRDFLRVGVRFNQLGRTGLVAIGNEDTCLDYLDLPEVKAKQNLGAALMPVKFKSAVQTPEDLYASHRMAASRLAIVDTAVSLVKLTAQPLLLETERIISKRLQGSVASTITGFAKLQRNGSALIDKSLDYNAVGGANKFPAFMSPTNI
ncbi:MAG TPA: hypothetical protein VGN95_21590 [Pyrinomonadaceae bacterium]|jgi:hypothetical protein|nr:hypothetical protein [Pyrinomonadaceae bacterium]